MSSAIIMWTEIAFNIGYLMALWILVAKMLRKIEYVRPKDMAAARSLLLAFVALALGETGDKGFRSVAIYIGGLESRLKLFMWEIPLTGLGILSAAVAITFFYTIMLDAWRKRFEKGYGVLEYMIIIAAIARLILFIHPDNQWFSAVPPSGWLAYRSFPLLLQGLGVTYIVLRDGIFHKDGLFKLIGLLLLTSLTLNFPTVFLGQRVQWPGILDVSRALVNLAMLMVIYKYFFREHHITINAQHINKGIRM